MKIKLTFLLLLIWSVSYATAREVSVKRNVQQTGPSTYEIYVTIKKSDLGCFAQLRQELPQGVTIEPMRFDGSGFKKNYGDAVFTWVRMPKQNTLRIAYRINGENSKERYLTSQFSYQVRNTLATILLDPLILEGVEEEIATQDAGKEQAASNEPTGNQQAEEASLSGNRYVTYDGDHYRVRLEIDARGVEKALSVQEHIPENFTAAPESLGNADFSLNKGTLELTWKPIPKTGKLEVTYTLRPLNSQAGYPQIRGTVKANTGSGTLSANIQSRSAKDNQKDKERVENAKDLWGN